MTDTRAPVALSTFGAPSQGMTTVAFVQNGHLLAVASDDTVQLWDVTDPRAPLTLAARTIPNGHLQALAASPDGAILVGVSNDTATPNVTTDDPARRRMRLWDITNARMPTMVATLEGGKVSVLSDAAVAFVPHGRTFAATNGDGTAGLWDAANPAQSNLLVTLNEHIKVFLTPTERVAFSPDGRLLAKTGIDGNAWLWDLTEPRQPGEIATLTQKNVAGGSGSIVRFAFSSNGHTFATVAGGTVRLWDLTTPAAPSLIATLDSDVKTAMALAFSPDGHTLAVGGNESVDLRETDPQRVTQQICATTGNLITNDEWTRYVPGLPYDPPCRVPHR